MVLWFYREKICESLQEWFCSVVIFFILDGSFFFLEATMYTEGFLLSNTIALSKKSSLLNSRNLSFR